MKYTLKSKTSLEELIEILHEQEIRMVIDNPFVIEADIENDEEYDIFTNIVAFYVSYSQFRGLIQETLIKQGISKDEVMDVVDDILMDITTSHYFFTLTRIRVREYFENLHVLNFQGFYLFNMKGFKEEVKAFTLNFYEERKSTLTTTVEEINLKDVHRSLRERAIENGIDLNEFKEIHIFEDEGYLQVESKSGEVIKNDFFLKYLGSDIEFDITGETAYPQLFEGLLLSSCMVQIFESTKLVIHECVSQEAKDTLLLNMNAIKKEHSLRVKVIMCTGCDRCA